jgi:hypothetical protein
MTLKVEYLGKFKPIPKTSLDNEGTFWQVSLQKNLLLPFKQDYAAELLIYCSVLAELCISSYF